MANQKRIIIISIIVSIITLAIGGYFFFKIDPLKLRSEKADAYTDLLSICGKEINGANMSINCKALLTNITTQEQTNCFETLVITKQNTTKEISFCGSNMMLIYPNEILAYKKLMPIRIDLAYSKIDILNNYALKSIVISPIDQQYIQILANNAIQEITTIDKNETTIQNSSDFCLQPSKLPDYITSENKSNYSNFYTTNLMDKNYYENGYYYNLDDTTIRLLFGKDSQLIAGYKAIKSSATNIPIESAVQTLLEQMPNIPSFGKTTDDNDKYFMKELSLLYDGVNYIKLSDYTNPVASILGYLNTSLNINEDVYCAAYKLFSELNDASAKAYALKLKTNLLTNVEKVTSPLCSDVISKEEVDMKGLFIKLNTIDYDTNLELFDKCKMLNLIIN